MTVLNDDDERKLQELARLEKLKQPLPPYVPPTLTQAEITAEQAERDRLEDLKKPSRLPSSIAPDFIEVQRQRLERERRHEKLKAAVNARLE